LIHIDCLINSVSKDNWGMIMKALSLFSGGLDSILAVKLIEEQGIDVVGIFFETPFFTSQKAVQSAQNIGFLIKIVDITDSLFKIVLSPKYGYGRGLNPCIDCHILMYKTAGDILEKEGADFIISGEVLGQRPMSQNLQSLSLIAHNSGFKELILRPLSAKRLPESLPEREGWVVREKLLGISGRSRKPQIELARKFGIEDYPSPAGGCLLANEVFSRRLKDLISFNPEFSRREIELLKWGRHFRVNEKAKVVVGRNQRENEAISSLMSEEDTLLTVEEIPGPTVLVTGQISPDELDIVASIAVSYSDAEINQRAAVCLKRDSQSWTAIAMGIEKEKFYRYMI